MGDQSDSDPQYGSDTGSDNIGKNLKAATVGGAAILFSPVLIIFSPVWVPLFLIYWVYSYVTGKHPIGADQMDQVRDKIFESVEEVKNKLEQLGKDFAQVGGGGGGGGSDGSSGGGGKGNGDGGGEGEEK